MPIPLERRPRRRSDVSAALFCTVLALAAPALATPTARANLYDLPAQPLSDALLALGLQSGLEISFPPAAVAGKTAPALRGEYSALTALNHLLTGSGLTLRADGSGRYVVFVDKTNPFSASRLEPVRIYGEQIGERIYGREEIAQTPSSNRDLSTLMATHPAVRTNPGAAGSQNRGSLDVEDISFYGASPYQNLFQVDGMDASNRVDPASKNLNLKTNNIASNSQSYFVDTSLLEDVRVYDNSIPVEYGRFTGGVVDARLRRFSGENHLKLDYRWNTSNMTQQRVAQGDASKWAQGRPGYSPIWQKRFYTAVGDIAFNDKAGAVLTLSHRQSDITRANMGVDDAGQPLPGQATYRDRIDNFLGKFSLRAGADTVIDLALKYSDRSETLSSYLFRDTRWDNNHGARGVSLNLEHRFTQGRFSLQGGWDTAMSNRYSSDNELVTQRPFGLPKYTTGGLGREQTQQDTWTLKSRVDLAPLHTGVLTHGLYAGVDLQRVDAGFKRYQQSASLQRTYGRSGTYRDSSKDVYLPGTVATRYAMASLYLNDRIEWRRLALDSGLRYDYETFLGNSNVSPRTRLEWDMFGSGNTLLSTSWSRYVGAGMLNTALEAERGRLRRRVLDKSGAPVADGDQEYFVDYRGLRMPYDDEWAVSLRQRMAGLQGVLGYVRRNGRDQWAKSQTGRVFEDRYRYRNSGHSITDSVSLTLSTLEPWRAGETRWNMRTSWSWQRRKANNDLAKGYGGSSTDTDELVIYNDVPIRAFELPDITFYQPQTANLTLIGAYPRMGLTWSNMLNWRSKRNAIIYVGRGPAPAQLEKYKSGGLASFWTWDTKLTWQPPSLRNMELTVEVLNLLNRMPALTASNPNFKADNSLYQSGREFWLQVGYRF
ncbi:Outer membrane receptor for ferric coprogen and ferric-rhodotorulic acid [Achromobacter sp. 2789STDY5608615]|uniref:TonB-dependent receptor n=1 Tax=Achromobacter sp. 2789STDY5608615 TaxID=1806492 RepID=UPI0006C17E80|nr:TonB-dependent receptor [Achromobacter sp. 2789STDY5608615]CUJ97884.1 Outer membrane receptor for ferric coprogen and ferric-rhodotorulic acid [Achromobacter sp. 2789STDY5608615]